MLFDTLESLLASMRQHRAQHGHRFVSADDPLRLRLGFTTIEDPSMVWTIRLGQARQANGELRELLRTPQGRLQIANRVNQGLGFESG